MSDQTDDLLLSPDQVAQVTGIKSGRFGKKREELQCEQLRKMGIPFYRNARGAPIVVRDALTGHKPQQAPHKKWEPSVTR